MIYINKLQNTFPKCMQQHKRTLPCKLETCKSKSWQSATAEEKLIAHVCVSGPRSVWVCSVQVFVRVCATLWRQVDYRLNQNKVHRNAAMRWY